MSEKEDALPAIDVPALQCMHMSAALHVALSIPQHIEWCVHLQAFDVGACVGAHVHAASKPLHVTCYWGGGTNNPLNTPSILILNSTPPCHL